MKTQTAVTHTPGPWKMSPPLGEGSIQIQSKKINSYGNFILAEIPNRVEEDLTNAHLIACAPEMLDLIKRMNYAFYVEGTSKALKEIMNGSKALIAKAEGR